MTQKNYCNKSENCLSITRCSNWIREDHSHSWVARFQISTVIMDLQLELYEFQEHIFRFYDDSDKNKVKNLDQKYAFGEKYDSKKHSSCLIEMTPYSLRHMQQSFCLKLDYPVSPKSMNDRLIPKFDDKGNFMGSFYMKFMDQFVHDPLKI